MKFVLASDIHLLSKNPVCRMDDLVERQFGKFEFMLGLAKTEGAAILQAGDMCDKPRSWILLPRLIETLKKYEVPIYCIFGQHDTYMYSDETRDRTSLGVLEKAGLVTILSNVPVVISDNYGSDLHIYGASFGNSLPKPIHQQPFNIGVIHASISDHALWPDHKPTQADKYLKDNPDYDLILCGDIHCQFEAQDGTRMIVNTGPMLRKEATEYNFTHKPQLMVLDTDTRTVAWVCIPTEDAKYVISADHIQRAEDSKNMLDEFVSAIKDGDDVDNSSFIDNLWPFVRANKISKDVIDELSLIIESGTKEDL
jgi:DNA repair exonuclease SbcCD nuclease subunit